MRMASLWVNSESVVVVVTDAARKTLHMSRLSSITGLAALSLLIVFILLPSALGAQEDSWFDSLKDAKGMKVGSRASRFGDLEGTAKTEVPGTPRVDRGVSGERGTGHGEDAAPRSIDPKKEDTARLIREWISTARPPENAVKGNNVRYSNKGNVVGKVRGGVIQSRHETGGIDPVFLWTNKKKLDSVDHCTMEEYVVARLKSESVSRCAGRYGAVRDLKGLRLAEAKTAVTGAGFEYALAPGAPAKAPEQEGTVERQEPGPEQYLKKGQAVTLTVHSPFVPAALSLPDFTGKPLGEARKWLEKNKLAAALQPGSPAPAAGKSGTVEKQGPAPGSRVKAGETVTLTVHSDYVDLRTVPNLVGLSAGNARMTIAAAGLTMVVQPGGQPSTREQARKVERQHPDPGTTIPPGAEVTLFVYAPYVETSVVPDVRGLSYTDARARLEAAGLMIDRREAGKPAERRLADTAQRQEPAAGTKLSKGQAVPVWFFGPYTPTREELVAATDCSRFPGSRAYWDNNAGKPLCGCFDGLAWNLANTQCVTAEVLANELCARDLPGSVAQGKTPDGKINCVCPQGFVWTADNKRCVQQPAGPPLEQCGNLTAQIRHFMDLYRRDPRNNGHIKYSAELIATQARSLGCDQGQIQQALGTGTGSGTGSGTGGGGGNEEDGCHCIDERGRRYREAFGQPCGTGGAALRDYNCAGGGGGGGGQRRTGTGSGGGGTGRTGGGTDAVQAKTPRSCFEPGVAIIYWLIDPPPYTGKNPVCKDGSGKLWFGGPSFHPVSRLVMGQKNVQTGCYGGSQVVTPGRTYPGSLCGP